MSYSWPPGSRGIAPHGGRRDVASMDGDVSCDIGVETPWWIVVPGAVREVDGTGAARPCLARQSKIHPKSCSRGRAVMVNREGVSQ
jgi:hypothetical protein